MIHRAAAAGLIFFSVTAVHAAAFWPSSATPLTRAQISRDLLLQRSKAKFPPIVIDDQVFAQDQLIKSGFSGRPWPGGKVIYSFDASLTAAQKATFLQACGFWSAAANVSCVERTTEAVYDLVATGPANNSTVGMPVSSGKINIHDWGNAYIVAHEIGHALGLAHEHQRNDRDSYITVLTTNIIAGKESNFTPSTSNYESTSYDFDSVMHYSGTAFGKKDAQGARMTTIQVLQPYSAQQSTIGQRTHLSASDQAGMASHYGAAPKAPH